MNPNLPPYYDIVSDLIVSVMRAQYDLLIASKGDDVASVPDNLINRNFTWLTYYYDLGINRHFFDAFGDNYPLRKKLMRAKKRLPSRIKEILEKRLALPIEGEIEKQRALNLDDNDLQIAKELIQEQPTRISRLIKAYCGVTMTTEKGQSGDIAEDLEAGSADARGRSSVELPSPLSIVFDFLTVPDMPGSRAYALVALRNYLFDIFNVYPQGHINTPDRLTFSIKQVEEGMARIWTSLRPRHFSSGDDKLPPEGRVPVDGIVRHMLGLKGMLWLRFRSPAKRIEYCSTGDPRGSHRDYEFTRSAHLEKLPDLGEIVNEIWGLPLPIRGADTILRGGLKFSSRGGLVAAIHGGPGTGKTSLALAIGAYLAPLGIQTLFLTAEEDEADLRIRVDAVIPDEYRRLSFFPSASEDWLTVPEPYKLYAEGSEKILDKLEEELGELRVVLQTTPSHDINLGTPKPCRAIIVLDGLHDLFAAGIGSHSVGPDERAGHVGRLRQLIERFRDLEALVILTTGEDWAGDAALDYLVDVAIRLTHESAADYGRKPDRRLLLSKARHQLCATGTHSFQLSGAKGVRFSPQINYQLDRRALWKASLPNTGVSKDILRRTFDWSQVSLFPPNEKDKLPMMNDVTVYDSDESVFVYKGSNIFINGRGSGGKAALALKLAIAPSRLVGGSDSALLLDTREKVLIVSFLYPEQYYKNILQKLINIQRLEYRLLAKQILRPHIDVIHLYPGYYQPNDLFNRIEWTLDAAELQGIPYTSVIIEGIHNVFLQFPALEGYKLIWPQLYASLRSRALTIITTHTTLVVPDASGEREVNADDNRSEPLRHALVQKTDFQFEVDRASARQLSEFDRRPSLVIEPNTFILRTLSAINQSIPSGFVLWSRERLVLFGPKPSDEGLSNRRGVMTPGQEVLSLG